MQDQIVELLIPIVALIYSAGFFLLWLRARDQTFILALVFTGCARALGFFLGDVSYGPFPVLADVIPYLCFTSGVIALVWAVCQRSGQRSYLKLHLAIVAIGLVLLIFASLRDNFLAGAIVVGTVLGLIAASGAHTLANAASRTVLDKVIMWMTLFYAAQFFIRPLSALTFDPGLSTENYGDSIYQGVVIVNFAVMTILHSSTLIIAILIDQFRSKEMSSETDPLTGLKMRAAFEEKSVAVLENAGKRRSPVSMIVADIDHFKQVNDIWGHQAGDQAIASFGELLRSMVRTDDLCGRIGGEEFCVIVRDCEIEAARKLAERICSAFERMEHEEIGAGIRLTASFGVASWREGEGYGKIFARADSALYAAKEGGRNRVESESEKERPVAGDRRSPNRADGPGFREAG